MWCSPGRSARPARRRRRARSGADRTDTATIEMERIDLDASLRQARSLAVDSLVSVVEFLHESVDRMARIFSEDLPGIPLSFQPQPWVHIWGVRGPKLVAAESNMSWNIHEWELEARFTGLGGDGRRSAQCVSDHLAGRRTSRPRGAGRPPCPSPRRVWGSRGCTDDR